MDYTGILNEKENQIVELEKKIQNLEERLRRAGKRENELEDEIVRLKSAFKSVSNPNITRQELEKILIGAQEYRVLD
jgi:chromosome segregation ATPase